MHFVEKKNTHIKGTDNDRLKKRKRLTRTKVGIEVTIHISDLEIVRCSIMSWVAKSPFTVLSWFGLSSLHPRVLQGRPSLAPFLSQDSPTRAIPVSMLRTVYPTVHEQLCPSHCYRISNTFRRCYNIRNTIKEKK